MEPIIGIDKEGERPTKSRNEVTATDNQVRIAYWRQPISNAEQFSRGIEAKNGANYRNRTDDLLITSELLYRLS